MQWVKPFIGVAAREEGETLKSAANQCGTKIGFTMNIPEPLLTFAL